VSYLDYKITTAASTKFQFEGSPKGWHLSSQLPKNDRNFVADDKQIRRGLRSGADHAADMSTLFKTSNRISENPPRGGLFFCGASVANGT
jgi:hypothetical protein